LLFVCNYYLLLLIRLCLLFATCSSLLQLAGNNLRCNNQLGDFIMLKVHLLSFEVGREGNEA
jgi:hypothetical protein